MKKVVASGFLAFISTLWAMGISAYVQLNLLNTWSNSRFWESASDMGLTFPLVLSLIGLAAGVGLLIYSYFDKEK